MVKRKANGEGTITKLPSGNYRLRTVDEINGMIVRKSFTASSPTACKTAHTEWLKSDNKVPIEKVKTVEEWALHWLEIYCKPSVSYSSYKDYKMYVNKHIIPRSARPNWRRCGRHTLQSSMPTPGTGTAMSYHGLPKVIS